MDEEQLRLTGGYDHNFVLNGEGMKLAATLKAPVSGRVMKVYTDKPGIQLYTGNMIEVTTVEDVDDFAKIAEEMHAKGGVVIASIKVNQPWILTNLEPHVDGLIAHFGVAQKPQMDIVTGVYAPTGKMPITMVSCNEVIAVETKTLEDGTVAEICVSPNDVPGYDKDQYIDPAILAKVKGGSYAYCDEDGNYYRSGFGLRYE